MAEISPLRRRMIEDMTVRNLSPATQQSYIHAVSRFSQYFGHSPDRLVLEDVRAYQVHLVSKGISWASLNQIVCALRFFYGVTLGHDTIPERIAYAREPRWCAREKETGSPAARPRGGDRWSARIDAHSRLIVSLVEESCDITLKELAAQLAEHGHRFSIGSLWRFFDRHAITWKKDRACERTGPAGHLEAARGMVREPA